MILNVPDEFISPLKLKEEELLLELAVALYAAEKLSFGKARALAGLDWLRFRQILAERNIPSHYNLEDFKSDLKAVDALSNSI